MSTMDLKLKGITWVGNMYQKFEAMCQEVDDIVSQDTVRYVENQVQTVGESLKKFCSDVVQDILPPFVDPGNCEAQAVALKQNATYSNIKSIIDIEENPVDTDIRQSSVGLHVTNPVSKELSHASSFSGLHSVNELIPAPSMDPIEGAESDLSSRHNDSFFIYKNSDVSIEEHATEKKPSRSEVLEETSPSKEDSCEAILFSESLNENHENTCGILAKVSPPTSFYGTEFKSQQKLGLSCNMFAHGTECIADVSRNITSSELSFSVVSCENKIAEMGLMSSSGSLSTVSHCLSDTSATDFPQKAEHMGDNPVDAAGCASDISRTAMSYESVLNASGRNQVAESGLASSSSAVSLDANDLDSFNINGTVSLTGSSENRNEQHCDSIQVGALLPSLEFGQSDGLDDYITDPAMETIELCDKVKLEDSCVIVDGSEHYAVSFRARNLGSYKKKIREAFASRKRLAKEYEQLAILYGDIDMECSGHTMQNLLPSISSTSLDPKKLPTHDLCDSEWELL